MERTNEPALFELQGLRPKEAAIKLVTADPETKALRCIVEKIDAELSKLAGRISLERSQLDDLEARATGIYEARAFLVDAVREIYPTIANEFDTEGE